MLPKVLAIRWPLRLPSRSLVSGLSPASIHSSQRDLLILNSDHIIPLPKSSQDSPLQKKSPPQPACPSCPSFRSVSVPSQWPGHPSSNFRYTSPNTVHSCSPSNTYCYYNIQCMHYLSSSLPSSVDCKQPCRQGLSPAPNWLEALVPKGAATGPEPELLSLSPEDIPCQ